MHSAKTLLKIKGLFVGARDSARQCSLCPRRGLSCHIQRQQETTKGADESGFNLLWICVLNEKGTKGDGTRPNQTHKEIHEVCVEVT